MVSQGMYLVMRLSRRLEVGLRRIEMTMEIVVGENNGSSFASLPLVLKHTLLCELGPGM